MKELRAFISININEMEIINEIVKIQNEFQRVEGRIKSIEQENIHITLKFLGNITEPMSKRIISKLNNVQFDPFELELKGLGCFPRPSRPRIIWVGCEKGTENVRDIYNQIESELSEFKFKKDRFRSHITISRVKRINRSEIDRLKKILFSFKNKDFGTIKVNSFQLMKSVLTPKGPIYSVLENFKAS
ncbi:MAG: RNA 2',3'-cyclic phosphodiesterase [Candidatus Lokiarchaeota archaeon]|nr:RNA 2',3'-cyclic phosphodiesterase [Candidatus Lokiarchaeota archaeon]